MKKHRLLFLLTVLCAVCVCMFASTPAQRKGRYYLLQGIQQDLEGNINEAYELYRLAHQSDPDNKLAAYRYGLGSLVIGDSAKIARGFALMKEYIEAYPSDLQEGLNYANLAMRINQPAESYRVIKRLYALHPDKTELLGSLAEISMYMNRPDTALYYINEDERLNGADMYLTNRKIMAYLAKGDTIGIMRVADDALRENPGAPYYYLLKGSIVGEVQGDEAALPYYLQADSLFPGNWDVKRALVMYYNSVNDSVALDKAMYQAMLTDDADLEDKIEMLTAYITPVLTNQKATEYSDYLMETLQEQYPYEPTVRSIAAQYSAAKGEMGKAAEQIAFAVDMESDNMEYRTMQIQYLVGDAKYQDAIKAYETIPENPREYPLLELLAASAYQGAEQYPKALEVVDTMIYKIMDGEDIYSLSELSIKTRFDKTGLQLLSDMLGEKGNILFLTHDTEGGSKAYDLALALIPDNSMMMNNYAYFLAKDNQELEKAAQMSLITVEENPDNPIYLDTYAYILFRQGKYEEAARYMEHAMEQSQENDDDISYDYYEHAGDIYSKLGQTDKALEMWRKALSLEPSRSILKDKIKAKRYIDE